MRYWLHPLTLTASLSGLAFLALGLLILARWFGV